MAIWAPPEITPELLRRICKETGGYLIPDLNDNLMLQCKGFSKIQHLDPYHNVRCLWLQENAISKIEGLDALVNLRTLYLHQNCLTSIENLDRLLHLNVLNICNNWITHLEGLAHLKQLETLLAGHCRFASFEAIAHLLACPSLQTVDVSHNKIDLQEGQDTDYAIQFWSQLPNLSVLYFHGNEAVNRTRHYRKKMVCAMEPLQYLDERPIFDNERRLALAWQRGGHEEETRERAAMAEEKRAEMKRDLQRWKELQDKGRALKEERERSWQVRLEEKKAEDEELRQLRIARQQDFMQTEGLEREGLAVEEYRATTQLLRTADALRAMVRQQWEAVRQVQAAEQRGRDALGVEQDAERTQLETQLEEAVKPRAPNQSMTEQEEYQMMLKELSNADQRTDNMMEVLQGVFQAQAKSPAQQPQPVVPPPSRASAIPFDPSLADLYAATPKTGPPAPQRKAPNTLWALYSQYEQKRALHSRG
eukprot:EG_transcript_9310